MKKARVWTIFVLAAVMLFATACSTQAPSAPAATTPAAQEAQPAQPSAAPAAPAEESTDASEGLDGTVSFGVTTALTGTNVMLGEFITTGAELAAEQINQSGGILGKELVLVFEDEVDNLQSSVNAMTKLMANDELSGLFGSTYSSYCLAALPILSENKIPMFTGGTSANFMLPENENPYLWQPCMSDDMTGMIMAKVVQDTFQASNPAILYVTDSFGTGLKDNIVAELAKLGITVDEANIYGAAVDEKNFTPIITQVQASGVDCFISINHETPAALICQQVQAAGLDIPLLGSATVATSVCYELAGDAFNGWYTVTEFVSSVDTEVGKNFVAAYEAKYGKKPDTSVAIAYDSVMLFKEACELAGTTTDREAINNAMQQIKDFQGVMTNYSYYGNCCLSSSKYLTVNENGEAKMLDTIVVR